MGFDLELIVDRHVSFQFVSDLIRVGKNQPNLGNVLLRSSVGRVVLLEDKFRTGWHEPCSRWIKFQICLPWNVSAEPSEVGQFGPVARANEDDAVMNHAAVTRDDFCRTNPFVFFEFRIDDEILIVDRSVSGNREGLLTHLDDQIGSPRQLPAGGEDLFFWKVGSIAERSAFSHPLANQLFVFVA